MKAMILAAGRGERMRPLTDKTPKPLLQVAQKALIEYHIEALVRVGISELVINHAWLGRQIEAYLGDGSRYGAKIRYSDEGTALETGGGIYRALPLLKDDHFLVVNGDIFTEFPYQELLDKPYSNELLHLVMVPNPKHNPNGDFCLSPDGRLQSEGRPSYTFSGIAAYDPAVFEDCVPGSFPLAPLLRAAMSKNRATGQLYEGLWTDVGTPERLQQINS
ncbi:MAG: N-acetylmuramate alpha-1-phosphate uridylyltransferase MurU [Thiohalomonadales bacterium]